MNDPELVLMTYHRPDPDESIEERFDAVVSGMQALDGPFSWHGLPIPPVPVVKRGNYSTWFNVKYPMRGLRHATHLIWRNREYLSEDHATKDDTGRWELRVDHPQIAYRDVCYQYLPGLSVASAAYRAIAYVGGHFYQYSEKHEEERQRLLKVPGINIDGRNNIFTLHPAQYWDGELCRRALGYGPEEVIRRLDGQVPLVRPLMDGVYTVFNDDPDLGFEDFCAFNDRFKPVLGLV